MERMVLVFDAFFHVLDIGYCRGVAYPITLARPALIALINLPETGEARDPRPQPVALIRPSPSLLGMRFGRARDKAVAGV